MSGVFLAELWFVSCATTAAMTEQEASAEPSAEAEKEKDQEQETSAPRPYPAFRLRPFSPDDMGLWLAQVECACRVAEIIDVSACLFVYWLLRARRHLILGRSDYSGHYAPITQLTRLLRE